MKNNGWGWRFTVYPVMGKKRYGSDRDILSMPSIHVVMSLLHSCLTVEAHEGMIQRLIAGLASCAQLTTLGSDCNRFADLIKMVKKLKKIFYS